MKGLEGTAGSRRWFPGGAGFQPASSAPAILVNPQFDYQ